MAMTMNAAMAQFFNVGVKLGADIHKIIGKSFSDQFSFGYHAGCFAKFRVNKKWAIQPEVLFSEVKMDTTSHFSDIYAFNAVTGIRLQYLQIPILANYTFLKIFSVQAGPQYGILINKNSSLLQNGRNAFSNGDFSLIGGLQVNIPKLKIYARYGIGLNNINDLDNRDKWKNQNIQLGLGYVIF